MRISDWSSDVCSSDLHSSPIQCFRVRETAMTRTLTLSLISALLLSAGAPAAARGDRNRDQDNLREAAAQGQGVPRGRLIADIRSRPPYNEMTYPGRPQVQAGRRPYKPQFLAGHPET